MTKSKNDSIGIYIARWVLLGYEAAAKAPTLCVAATGRGGADELAAALDASQVMYGLLRLTQRIDSSTTVKFACVSWLGDAGETKWQRKQRPRLQRWLDSAVIVVRDCKRAERYATQPFGAGDAEDIALETEVRRASDNSSQSH